MDPKMDPIDCIIKLGGSAITDKDVLETTKEQELSRAADILKLCCAAGLKTVVIHGAGSFGHHHAKKYQVNGGFLGKGEADQQKVKIGFCETRQSLNHLVVQTLLKSGIPAVSHSPCSVWKTTNGKVIQDSHAAIDDLLKAGFLPVLHGDCVLDVELGCKILSGDTIIKVLCDRCHVKRVVFLTDVEGVFNKPPTEKGASLIETIKIKPGDTFCEGISTTTNKHDVTGGISLKIKTATDIVEDSRGRTPVFICSINNQAAKNACLFGDYKNEKGTLIQYIQTQSL